MSNGMSSDRMETAVSAVRCGSYEEAAVREAMTALLSDGALDFVRPGMRVAIKMNLVGAFAPETAATTHPSVLKVLTELLIARGASVVIGDSPGGPFTAAQLNRAYAAAGLAPCEAAGAVLNRDTAQQPVRFDGARVLKTFSATAYLQQADAIINVCKLKTHGMLGLSASVKNLFGTIPGTVKTEYHFRFPQQQAFADMLIDLNEYWKSALCIADAVVAMEGNGPTAGKPRQLGALLASRSPYALDLACAALVGLRTEEVPTLAAAASRGLAPKEAASLAVRGEALGALAVPDFVQSNSSADLQFRSKLPGVLGRALGYVGTRALSSVPVCTRACVGCGKCASLCPAHAIALARGLAHIDRAACIRCFCCQEFCPVGAMRVKRPLAARLLAGGRSLYAKGARKGK